VRDTNSADVILDGSNLACAAGAVLVVGEARLGQGGVVVVVPRAIGVLQKRELVSNNVQQ
jgi:hypothetical protein